MFSASFKTFWLKPIVVTSLSILLKPINLVYHPMILQFAIFQPLPANKVIWNPELYVALSNLCVQFWKFPVGFVNFTCQQNPVQKLAKLPENIAVALYVIVKQLLKIHPLMTVSKFNIFSPDYHHPELWRWWCIIYNSKF